MLGLTSWCMMVPFKTRFVVSSFEKVLKITGFQRFVCLVGPYFFSVFFYTHTYFLAQTALQDHALKTIHIGKMLGQSTLHILGDGNYPTGKTTNNRRGFFSTNGGSCRLWNCEFFEINTLSQGVFDLWLNINDLAAASQFSLIVLFFVFVLLGSEPWIHRTQRFSSQTLGNISRKKLVGK